MNYRKIADFFGVLSHPVRIEIIVELLKNEKCVSDIRYLLEVKQPNVSQHLSILRANGIVDWCQRGKMKCYFLKEPEMMESLIKALKKTKRD